MGLEVIEKLKKQQGLTNEDLARLSGVPKGTIDKITAGTTKDPKLETVKAIARALGCTINDFDDFRPVRSLSTDEWEHIKKYRTLDTYGQDTVSAVLDCEFRRCTEQKRAQAAEDRRQVEVAVAAMENKIIPFRRSVQSVSAGTGTYLGPEEFSTIFVEDNCLTRRASFGVPVKGDSMEPIYHDGDTLIVENVEEVAVGEIGVFTIDGNGYVKKLGDGELLSLNSTYAPIPMNDTIRCNGKVIGVLRPEWIADN